MDRIINPIKVEDGIKVFLEDAAELGLTYGETMQVAKSIYFAVAATCGIIKGDETAPLAMAEPAVPMSTAD